jgi:diguanylate cyclase (GGDEF)-like protein/PAS domain S-box-containing protein
MRRVPDGEDQTDKYARVRAVAGQILAPVAVIARDGTLLYANHAVAHALGVTSEELLGRKMLQLVHPRDRARVQRELRHVAAGRPSSGFSRHEIRGNKEQGWRTFESVVHNFLDDDEIRGILVSSRDVTDQLAYEQRLLDAASRDPLTGLANRAAINEQLDELLRQGVPLAVGFLGIDRFKLINDSMGHTAGDSVLQAVAGRVASSVPSATTVGRFGGDLLVMLVTGVAATDAYPLAWRIIERVGDPLFVAGHELRIAMSAGVARSGASATAVSMLRDADLALHQAKKQGGGRAAIFLPEMRDEAVSRLELEADLRQGIVREEFELALQPIVSLAAANPVCAEALVRWHRDGQIVEPCTFVPVAEETGLIVPLGEWIIGRAAQLSHFAPGEHLRVNLSARQLASPGLVGQIQRSLATHRIPATSLGFEVTESLLMEQFDFAINVLSAIRRLGCKVGLDDFGTGYSSLGYLRRLPIDFLKVDGSLTADIDSNPEAKAILAAIVGMADALGMETIAEGIETDAQAATLRELGCTLGQGYLFGRPVEVTRDTELGVAGSGTDG